MTLEVLEYRQDATRSCGSGRHLFIGHGGGQGGWPSFSTGTTARTEPRPPMRLSHGNLGRAPSFAKATEDKDARLSQKARRRPRGLAILFHGHDGADGAAPSHAPFPRVPWPSILLHQGYGGRGRLALREGKAAARGLAALPPGGAHFFHVHSGADGAAPSQSFKFDSNILSGQSL